MTYNIHPLFVHFPIAFLLLYSLLKILPCDRWFPRLSFRLTRFLLLAAGVLGGFFASTTGEMAEHLTRPNHQLVEMHALFAGMSIWIFGILLVGEILFLANPYIQKKFPTASWIKFLGAIEKILTHKVLTFTLTLGGIIAIVVTGVLGGALVYGASADPIAPFVLKILGLQL